MILLNSNLQAFLSVADLNSVSAAAKQLKLSQTGTTKRIKTLEGELGVPLFTRSRTGMKLTVEGQFLLRHCLEVKNREGRLLSDLKKGGEAQEVDLTLVGPANLIAGRITHQCAAIYAKWPRLNLRLWIDVAANRLNHLKKGQADLAILHSYEVSNELDSKLLRPLEYVIVATSKWRDRTFKDIVEKERLFANHPLDPTGLDYLKAFHCLDLLRRPRLYVNENHSLRNLLIHGVGFGLLPREVAQDFVANSPLMILNQGRSLKIEMALAWYPRSELPSYFSEIIRSIK